MEIGDTTITTEIIIGLTIGTDLQTVIDVIIGEIAINLMKDGLTTDKTVGERILDKTTEIDKIIEETTPNNDTGIGVKGEIDPGIIVMTTLVEEEIEMDGYNKGPRTLSDDRERPRSRSNSRVSTNRD